GVVASRVALAFVFLLAVGMKALLSAFGLDLPSTTLQLLPRTVVAAFAVGVGTTLVSSVMPAIRASRVAPLAALRESQPAEFRFSTRRTIAGAIITLTGATILLVALSGGGSNAAARVGLGAAA